MCSSDLFFPVSSFFVSILLQPPVISNVIERVTVVRVLKIVAGRDVVIYMTALISAD